MKLLVLGGTVFVGRALVEHALARGHEVTLFHRGLHNADLFPDVERLRGDRDGHLEPLRGRRFDAVIDTSGYVPRVVRASAELLTGSRHHTFISTMSVYADFRDAGKDEEAPLGELADPASEDVLAHYGPLKAACERVVQSAAVGRALIVRPGIIVGPHDPTDRFTYWVTRVAKGGAVLAPGRPEAPLQLIDVRDLARWTIASVEEGRTGVYNATGPAEPLTWRELLETCRRASGSGAELVWVDDAFLLERGVKVFVELPLWMPVPGWEGLFRTDVSRALAAGLRLRPLEETARDTLAWRRAHPDEKNPVGAGVELPPSGLTPEREAELLAAWREDWPFR